MSALELAEPITLLFVEDDLGDQHAIKRMLKKSRLEHTCVVASTLQEAQFAFEQHSFDCILLDWNLPDGLGRDFLQSIPRTLPVILLTGEEHGVSPSDAFSWGFYDYLSKNDLTPALLARVLRYALIRHESLELDERVVAVEKLKLVGRVASGVAHEVNNPLGWLSSNLDWIKSELSLDAELSPERVELEPDALGELREVLSECKQAMERIQGTSGNLAEFAELKYKDGEQLELNAVIIKVISLLGSQLAGGNLIRTNLAPYELFFEGNPGLLVQILTHLLINAKEAIERAAPSPNHEIAITTWREGARIVLQIEDTGDGLAPFNKDEVFQPFVTHAPHKSGMGLAFVARAIDIHGGDVGFEDEERGACVKLSFPARERPKELFLTEEITETEEIGPELRILIVDKMPHMTKLFLLLAGARCEFVRTTDLSESIELLERDNDFDGVFVNVSNQEFRQSGLGWYQNLALLAPDIAKRVVICAIGDKSDNMDDFLVLSKAMLFKGPFDFTGLDPIIWHWKKHSV